MVEREKWVEKWVEREKWVEKWVEREKGMKTGEKTTETTHTYLSVISSIHKLTVLPGTIP
ncbi:MAG: hypothetical protein ABFD25_20610 [Clostridiaceae bacterium]